MVEGVHSTSMEDGGEVEEGDKNSCKIGSLKVKKDGGSGRKKCGIIQRGKRFKKIGKLSTLTRKQ